MSVNLGQKIQQTSATVAHRRMVIGPADAGTTQHPENGDTGETSATAGDNETAGKTVAIRGIHLLSTGAGTMEIKQADGTNLAKRMIWESGTASAQIGGAGNYNMKMSGGFSVITTTAGYWVITYDFI